MIRIAIGMSLAAVSLAGCYSADALRQRPPIRTAEFAGSPVSLGQCLADQYLFEHDLPLEVATDNETGQTRVTRLVRRGASLTGPVYYWEVHLSPLGGGASRAEFRSNWLPVGEYVDADAVTAMLQSCSTRESAPERGGR